MKDIGSGGLSASEQRLREAQKALEQPKLDLLTKEATEIVKNITYAPVMSREDFIDRFRTALKNAERFAEGIYLKQAS